MPVEISGNRFFSSQYLIGRYSRVEEKEEVEKIITNILEKYNDAGFPFCRVSPEVSYLNNTPEKIILHVDEGARVLIGDYLFNTNGKTEKSAIKRILRIKGGDYFSFKKVVRSKKRLLKTEVFDDINESIVFRDDRYYLLFDLKEKKSDQLTFFGSLAEDNFNLGISFYSLNLLGTLRRLQFSYEYKKLLSLYFTEPIFISPAIINGSFSLWTYDSARLIKLEVKIKAPVTDNFDFSLISGIETANYYGDDSLTSQHTNSVLGMGIEYSHDALNWSTLHAINFEYLFREVDRVKINYDGRLEIKKFVIRPHYHWIRTDSFEYFDYMRPGGARDLRGYLEDEFIVPNAFWLNIEYRKLFIFPLFDLARIQNKIFYSYGFGIAATSNFADASVIFAWPRGGQWRDGKVHLTFMKDF